MNTSAFSFVFLLWATILSVQISAQNNHKLIVLLIDGFRWNYFDNPKLNLKGFPKLVKYGVRAPYLKPVYPSLTYPNMLSFSTGLYPEHHGFYQNMLWDNDTNTFFEMIPVHNSSDPIWWQDAEPVWITAEKSGKRTAMYWWQGCEVRIHGHTPYICESHAYRPPSEEVHRDLLQRVDDVIEMFKPSPGLHEERLDLALMYYGGIDWAGHYVGEDGLEFKKAMHDIDDVINYIIKEINKANLQNKVNLMVLSDHGMADVRNSTFISLEKYDPLIAYQINSGPFISLVPKQVKEDQLYSAMKSDNITGVKIYRRKDVPEEYHIKNAKRFGPIIMECEQGYFVSALRDESKRIGDIAFQDYYGEHGYAPQTHEDMNAIFLATGPDFRSGFKTQPLEMIDLYNVMCRILGIDGLPNNGSLSRVASLYRTSADGPYHIASHAVAVFPHCYYITIIISVITAISLYSGLNYFY